MLADLMRKAGQKKITLRSTSKATGNSGSNPNNITVAKPAGASVGDVLIAVVTGPNSQTPTMTGFTLVRQEGTTSIKAAILFRVVDGTEGATLSGVYGTQGKWTINVTCWAGVNTTTPIDAQAGTPSMGASVTAPSVTTTVPAMLLAIINTTDGNAPSMGTSTMTLAEIANAANTYGILVAYEEFPIPGATGTRGGFVSQQNTTAYTVAQTIALKRG